MPGPAGSFLRACVCEPASRSTPYPTPPHPPLNLKCFVVDLKKSPSGGEGWGRTLKGISLKLLIKVEGSLRPP